MCKVIHLELWKKFKFDHTTKWYVHNLEPVLENETHTILLDFEVQTDHVISARRPELVIVYKKKKNRTCWMTEFAVPDDHGVKLK